MAEAQSTQGSEMDLEEMQDKALDGLKQARGTVEDFARANPRTAIGIALGLGFILGGGLTPRVLLGIGAIAARRFARDYARDQLQGFTRGVMSKGGDRESASA